MSEMSKILLYTGTSQKLLYVERANITELVLVMVI